ncbi:hypothetical protein [Leptothoe spongobia]|uniref:Uncharacterized protein n=1 Tax=Leptothoe spongobia TAU-MAC 1115 TaxID=1967444 RepID=A0A947GJN5_9CYAN|nr:hypothetical protein [Leptothoe spongobia]MBT9317110.1 hypothetical protein [Leptothoe spongobia TAU-MAC 1115]
MVQRPPIKLASVDANALANVRNFSEFTLWGDWTDTSCDRCSQSSWFLANHFLAATRTIPKHSALANVAQQLVLTKAASSAIL